jgi:antitoxin (DNA-binding transcriptional repressor) of toxin-antitoxin stability system
MTTMTIDQAKDHLAELLARAADGEEVVIVRDDGSTFSVVPSPPASHKRRGLVGSMRGKIWMAPDFDDILEGFEPYLGDDSTDDGDHPDTSSDDAVIDLPKNSRGSYGIVKGQIWMAPDFDAIPEGFEPYLGDDENAG